MDIKRGLGHVKTATIQIITAVPLFPFSSLSHTPLSRRDTPVFKKNLGDWLLKLDLRFDCSHKDALEYCNNDEDAEWLRRVRVNLPSSFGSRDVIYEKKMEKVLKRKATEERREANRQAKWEKEQKVRLSLLL